jgi:site-specific DNA-methyltransferase (adenine-specific)
MTEDVKTDNVTLLIGDCLERMKEMPDGSVDLVLTDPPYNMTKTGNSCRPNYMPGGEILDGIPPSPVDWMAGVYRVLKEGSHFYSFCNKNDIRDYLNAADAAGFHLHNIINMIKDTNMPNRWYLKFTEPVLMFKKGKAKPINDLTSRDYEIVVMPKGASKQHPTEKPLKFMEKLVFNSTKENELVFDPFMGSGTTGMAAINLGRRFIGIEKNPSYFQIAKHRVCGDKTPPTTLSDFFGEDE